MPRLIQTRRYTESMGTSDSILGHIDEVKSRWLPMVLDVIADVGASCSPPQSTLVEMSAYHFSTGGKRLRALIPLLVAEALEVDPRRVVGFAAACEILHNATLVHDDLQDGDVVRRGKPTIWAQYGAARAINLGDAMLYWTLAAAGRVEFDDASKLQLVQRIVADTLAVIDGQEREFELQSADAPTLDAYFRMVTGKTSGLFRLPMSATAQLCGAPTAVVHALDAAAGHLGVLFQLQDDVLDLYADKGREMRGSDIGEGKISALVAHFLAHGPASDAAWLRATLRAPREELTELDVERAATLFRTHGSLQWVLDEIERRRLAATEQAELAHHAALTSLLEGIAQLFVDPIASVTR